MENQKGKRVKMDIFGVFGKHFIRKKIFLCFLCLLKTNFTKFSETVLFFKIRRYEQGTVNIQWMYIQVH